MKTTTGKRNLAAGIPLLGIYVGSVWAANWLASRYGLIPMGFGLLAPAGTIVIGGVIMTRDFLQDAVGRLAVLAAILIGAGLSWLTASHEIAFASGVTFLLAETVEFAVYTPLRKRYGWGTGKWAWTVAAANAVGALADTLIFLHLAGFPAGWSGVAGQMLGKGYVTAAVIVVEMLALRIRKGAHA